MEEKIKKEKRKEKEAGEDLCLSDYEMEKDSRGRRLSFTVCSG